MSGAVIWFSGLPSSGKTTLARRVRERLRERNVPSCLLDGDEVRECLVPSPGYDEESRAAFYETLGGLAALLARQGLAALVAATAHRRVYRERARAVAPAFLEVFLDTPPEICESRDSKGLYRLAREGRIQDFPGVHEDFEVSPDSRRVQPAEVDVAVDRLVARIAKLPADSLEQRPSDP